MEDPSWPGFIAKMKQLYPEYSADAWIIKYKDEEGDMITVMSPREWDTMLQSEKSNITPIKLYIMDAKGGMAPTVNVIVVEAVEERKIAEPEEVVKVVEEEEEKKEAERKIPEAIGEKELPIEELLGFEIVQPPEEGEHRLVRTNDNFEGFMDMDVSVFFERLRQQACSLLDPADTNEALRKGKAFLQSLVPNENPPVVQDLIGVVDSVKQAFHDGYTNLKELPELKEFVAVLSSLSGNDAPDQKKKETKWASQLASLQSMGFTDRETNEALLVKYRGNLQRVVDTLLPEMN